jgi:predicted DNA-binding transcriptional regulator AlpA
MIDQWVEISGMKRSAVYVAMNAGNLPAIKVGRRTLVYVEAGLAWMRSQPREPTRQR